MVNNTDSCTRTNADPQGLTGGSRTGLLINCGHPATLNLDECSASRFDLQSIPTERHLAKSLIVDAGPRTYESLATHL